VGGAIKAGTEDLNAKGAEKERKICLCDLCVLDFATFAFKRLALKRLTLTQQNPADSRNITAQV
jgi:hypothetical protein